MQILLVPMLVLFLANVMADLDLNDDIPERTFYSTLLFFKSADNKKS